MAVVGVSNDIFARVDILSKNTNGSQIDLRRYLFVSTSRQYTGNCKNQIREQVLAIFVRT